MEGIGVTGLRLLGGEVKIPLNAELKKLGLFSSGQALPSGSAADSANDRLMLSPGNYLILAQGLLRSRAAQDICLRAILGGDTRFCGPQTTVSLAGADDLKRVTETLNALLHAAEKLPVPASRIARPFTFFGVVAIPPGQATSVELWGNFLADGTSFFGGEKSPVTFVEAELLALRLSNGEPI